MYLLYRWNANETKPLFLPSTIARKCPACVLQLDEVQFFPISWELWFCIEAENSSFDKNSNVIFFLFSWTFLRFILSRKSSVCNQILIEFKFTVDIQGILFHVHLQWKQWVTRHCLSWILSTVCHSYRSSDWWNSGRVSLHNYNRP